LGRVFCDQGGTSEHCPPLCGLLCVTQCPLWQKADLRSHGNTTRGFFRRLGSWWYSRLPVAAHAGTHRVLAGPTAHIDSPGGESGVSADQRIPHASVGEQQLFQMLVHGFRHLEHVQLLSAEDWLQFFISDDLALICGVLKFVLL